jgi:hypothetical protein
MEGQRQSNILTYLMAGFFLGGGGGLLLHLLRKMALEMVLQRGPVFRGDLGNWEKVDLWAECYSQFCTRSASPEFSTGE